MLIGAHQPKIKHKVRRRALPVFLCRKEDTPVFIGALLSPCSHKLVLESSNEHRCMISTQEHRLTYFRLHKNIYKNPYKSTQEHRCPSPHPVLGLGELQ